MQLELAFDEAPACHQRCGDCLKAIREERLWANYVIAPRRPAPPTVRKPDPPPKPRGLGSTPIPASPYPATTSPAGSTKSPAPAPGPASRNGRPPREPPMPVLQILDATNADAYFWAIRERNFSEANRAARELAQRLGPQWRDCIAPFAPRWWRT